jgi:hypothetical protein
LFTQSPRHGRKDQSHPLLRKVLSSFSVTSSSVTFNWFLHMTARVPGVMTLLHEDFYPFFGRNSRVLVRYAHSKFEPLQHERPQRSRVFEEPYRPVVVLGTFSHQRRLWAYIGQTAVYENKSSKDASLDSIYPCGRLQVGKSACPKSRESKLRRV